MTENIAEIIGQAQSPTGEWADLSRKAQRLNKALEIAEKWVRVSGGDSEMFNRAQIAYDQIQEELSRTVFAADVIEQKRIIAHGRAAREGRLGPGSVEATSEEDLHREARDSALSNWLLDAYTTLSDAPLEIFGVGDRVAEERVRYAMMGALMVAVDAAVGKLPEDWQKATH